MIKISYVIWIIIIVVILIIIGVIFIYNRLVTMRNRVDESWADIDVQLKRRYDLIPNLVETVKGYAAHEKEVFEKVTEARAGAISASSPLEQASAEDMLSRAMKSLFAVAENYPTLRASENFKELQEELTDTENKIEYSRRFYNSNVRDYNISIQKFPNTIVASSFGFKEREMFQVKEALEREAVKVSFLKAKEQPEEAKEGQPEKKAIPEKEGEE